MSEVWPDYVAHVSEDGNRAESVITHLQEVAEMASGFADVFSKGEWGYAAGILHDIGKYSREFQRRILQNGPKVDHSTAGAYIAATKCSLLLAYCIAGHHGGLPDGGVRGDYETTLQGRLNKAKTNQIPAFEAFEHDVQTPGQLDYPFSIDESRLEDVAYCEETMFEWSFFTRMIFSCLVDADYLCTERFMRGEEREHAPYLKLSDMRERLEEKLAAFYPPKTYLNKVRCGVLDDCKRAASRDPGVFSLTVPTGGGKTLALMRFALWHATMQGRTFDRVIVTIPFTSIIEQNAEVYRSVFGSDSVLEHHSSLDFDDGELSALRLAAENWDAPLIVTTNVQLLESLFANKTSRCRKLHNIARSVIVLDEAQMIPTQFAEPCVKGLAELVKHYGCSVVLCTATQPAFNSLFEREGLGVHEIASHPAELVEGLRRVTYRDLGVIEDQEIVQRLLDDKQALCIVNSRRQARNLFELVVSDARVEREAVFHLSTLMCPAHRSRVVDEVRTRIKAGLPCILIATSLVEAGVDLDFKVVYRALSGVDSLVQAAGRCNREMKRPAEESTVYLFDSSASYKVPGEVMLRSQVARGVLKAIDVDGRANVDSLDVIENYFKNLYTYRNLDNKGVLECLSRCSVPSIPFAKVASLFRLIDEATSTVIIPTPENSEDIEALVYGRASRYTLRRLSRYGVGVYKQDRDSLWDEGAIEAVGENVYLLRDQTRYDSSAGLSLRATPGEAVFL